MQGENSYVKFELFCCKTSKLLLQAIGSLIELMKLVGARRITHVKMKIIAMLRYYVSEL